MQLNKGYKMLKQRQNCDLRKKKKHSHLRKCFITSCGDSRIRTGDPMLAKHVLYQLSYTPENEKSRSGVRLSSRDWQS